jgi:hypothetical protein
MYRCRIDLRKGYSCRLLELGEAMEPARRLGALVCFSLQTGARLGTASFGRFRSVAQPG